jgi:hypothetical protein
LLKPLLFAACVMLAAPAARSLVTGMPIPLRELIDRSDHIVVATVIAGPAQRSTVPSIEPHRVVVMEVLKGPLAPRSELTVRIVPTLMFPIITRGELAEFVTGQPYVLFLYGVAEPYGQVMNEGSAFWVPRARWRAGVDVDPYDRVRELAESAVAHLKERIEITETAVERYFK